METTGSRHVFAMRPATALRLLFGAALLLALAGLSAMLATERADAGAVGTLVVNSTANIDDGKCTGPPNDLAVGNCTFREAINDVNAGLADEIKFHQAVFPSAVPGVIFLELGLGPLPPINREVKIDAKQRGVVLDGDFDNDGLGVPWGVVVIASHNGFDFELNGGGETFIIQDIGCDPGILGAGDESVSGPGIPILCLLGSGDESIQGPGLFPIGGVGLLIAGLCDELLFDQGGVAGPFLPCCPVGVGGGGAADEVAGPGSCFEPCIEGPGPCCILGDVSGPGPCCIDGGVSGPGPCCQGGGDNSVQGCPPCGNTGFDLVGGTCGEGDDSVAGAPVIVGGNFSLGNVIIDGIEVHNAMGSAGVVATGTNINNFNLTNSWIEADFDGVDVIAFSPPAPPNGQLTNNNVHINENLITGGQGGFINGGVAGESGTGIHSRISGPGPLFGNGVFVDICCDLGSKVTVDVSNNDAITGKAVDGVWLNYCLLGGCASEDGSQFNYSVNNNGKVSGFFDGIHVDIFSNGNSDDPLDGEGHNINADIEIDGNAIVDGEVEDGIRSEVQICCRNSDNTATFNVTNNSDVVGGDDGVDIDAEVGEGPDNTVTANVDDNGEITGEGDDGVEVDVQAGSDMPAAEDTDADENTVNVSVSRNEDIAGDDDDGVDIDAFAGKEEGDGDADRNVTNIVVDDNGDIDGDDHGVDIDARAGTREDEGDADDNTTTVSVSGNGTIDGADDDGIDIDAIAGHVEEDQITNVTGDGNSTEVVVDGNGEIKGHDGHGVGVESRAGGLEPTGEENHTSVTVTNNEEIHGFQEEHSGIEIDSTVCCDPDNENGGQTNDVNISGNTDIIGNDTGDGIEIDLCCSFNTIAIKNNTGVIKSNDDDGIDIDPCGDAINEEYFLECIGDTVTILNISGNNVSDSGEDGMDICCGAFQFPLNQAPQGVSGVALKSVISNNTVSHNGSDGIDLDSTIGINIEHNDVFQNGTAVLDGDNGIEVDWFFGFFMWDQYGIKIPAHFNRISENSTYDNAGLGINLAGYSDLIGIPPVDDADGVGCVQFPLTPIGPNDCIPYPKLLFTGGPTVAKVSGTACANCHVEVFIADPTPTDQTGPLSRQHGEGRTYLVTTTADGLGDFSVNLPCGLAGGELTATATDKLKNTSEFSSNIPFPGTPACAAATEQPTEPPDATDTPVPPAPTATVAPPTATAEPAGVCGDVNSDGVTNSIDASLILQMGAGIISELPKGNAAGDVNSDGSTNAVDATLILQQAASMIAGLSC